MDQPGMTAIDEIATRSFSGAFRGFDRTEVRSFLNELAGQQKALVERAAEAESRLDDLKSRLESVEELLQSADEKYQQAEARLEEMEKERSASAAEPVAHPEHDAVQAFGEKVTEVLQIAVAAGNSIRAEAEAWASQRRQEADELAANTLASARQEVADIVAREQTSVDQLRTTEQALRSWLQAAHSAIGRVLEQPIVEPGALAQVLGGLHELGPAPQAPEPEEDVWSPPVTEETQTLVPRPTVLTSYLG
jgi:DivIVA domain-containing protein